MKTSAVLAFFCLFSGIAHADQISENFSSRADFSSGTAIWNQALHALHPSLEVTNYGTGTSTASYDVGDGSDGPFDTSTYASFSQNGDVSGNIIRLDTSVHPILKVTNFDLAAGWLLEPVGTNPLIIESLSDVTIEGEIHCEGGNGGNAVGGTPGAGGIGVCGGMDGGAGGSPGASGQNGANAGGGVTGGQGGNSQSPAVCGGGGGSWDTSVPVTAGANSSASGGQAGTSVSDSSFSTIAGGAGGGGGGATATDAGGGGGAGGGVVIIRVVRDFKLGTAPSSVSGFIYASGGTGGGSNVNGGAGGGGGAGGVSVFAGHGVYIYNTTGSGASVANFGSGGSNALAATGGHGGPGRSWFSFVTYSGGGFYTPSEDVSFSQGNTQFNPAAETVISRSFDTGSSAPFGFSASITPSSSDFVLEAAGSSDNFVSDDTGWTTAFSSLTGKRYVRFQVTITTSTPTNPTMVSGVTISYTPLVRTDFNFSGACGRVDGGSPWNLLPLMLVILFLTVLKFSSQHQRSGDRLNRSSGSKDEFSL